MCLSLVCRILMFSLMNSVYVFYVIIGVSTFNIS
ncbi:unnamed protein product [Brassica oleracea var. botrytis]|uniref:(rape) hypothetical protein n=1 Tax=Brassica napus TaxID=3708 RepID=A0A816JXT9_BRANA|nr:unnamed protein product [Brassica napus]